MVTTKKQLREGLILNDVLFNANKYLSEIISLNEDNESPTFTWDITKEKLDKSKEGVTNKVQALKYLELVYSKIANLPDKLKVKIVKYLAISMVGLIGINNMTKSVENNLPEIATLITTELNDSTEFKIPVSSSDTLVNFLKYEEGSIKKKGEPVLSAYKLGDGMITVGWGHAQRISKSNITVGDTITYDEAIKLLTSDIKEAENGLNRLLKRWEKAKIKVKITQGMYDAMTSMIFNMGIGNFLKSDFIQLVKKGELDKASKEILTTNVTYKGHITRRQKESKMFKSK